MNKKDVAKKMQMPYLGDPLPRKGEAKSKSVKRFDRYMHSHFDSGLNVKAFGKSMKRNRKKNKLPF